VCFEDDGISSHEGALGTRADRTHQNPTHVDKEQNNKINLLFYLFYYYYLMMKTMMMMMRCVCHNVFENLMCIRAEVTPLFSFILCVFFECFYNDVFCDVNRYVYVGGGHHKMH